MAISWRDIAAIFEEIELKLIASLKRNLAEHKEWETKEGFNWPAWQGEKLRNIERYRRDNRNIMDVYRDTIDMETRALLEEQFAEGMERVDEEARELFPGFTAPEVTERNFFGVNELRLNSLIDDVQNTEKKVESAALRMMDDVYRQTIIKAEMAMAAGAATLPQAIDMAVKDFLKKGINCVEYKNGNRVNIADYVQMALRTASTRSYLQGEAKRREELGIDTVLVSQYGQCSDTCLPWQGRVYIDDVWGYWKGEWSGESGRSVNGKWYPLLSTAVENGLFHPNCRHTLSAWYEGVSTTPKPLDADTVRKNAALEQKQREIERNIRALKRLAEGTQESDKAKEYRRQVRMAQKELREFIAAHDDVLRRDYWRESIYGVPEVEKPQKGAIMKADFILDEKDISAIQRYISGESYALNAKIRGQVPLNPHEQQLVHDLDAALEKLPKFEGTVYRSLSDFEIDNARAFVAAHNEGQEIQFLQYLSTSTEVYDDFMPIQYIIDSKNARDLRTFNQNEMEILFPRGSTFTVTKTVGNTIYLEEI